MKIRATVESAGNASKTAKFPHGYPAPFTFLGSTAVVRVNYFLVPSLSLGMCTCRQKGGLPGNAPGAGPKQLRWRTP